MRAASHYHETMANPKQDLQTDLNAFSSDPNQQPSGLNDESKEKTPAFIGALAADD